MQWCNREDMSFLPQRRVIFPCSLLQITYLHIHKTSHLITVSFTYILMQVPVCIQLLEAHEQLLSAHSQQVCSLNDMSTTFLRGQAQLLHGRSFVGHPRLWEFSTEVPPAWQHKELPPLH